MALFEQTEPFESGQFVKTKGDVFGTVMPYDPSLHPTEPTVNPGKDGPSPFEMNNKVRIPKNSIGEVLSSDAFHTAVIFPINSTGRLQPQLIKAEGATSDFSRVVRGPIHPFLDAGGRRKDKAVDLTPEQDAAFGDKIISKWKLSEERPNIEVMYESSIGADIARITIPSELLMAYIESGDKTPITKYLEENNPGVKILEWEALYTNLESRLPDLEESYNNNLSFEDHDFMLDNGIKWTKVTESKWYEYQ